MGDAATAEVGSLPYAVPAKRRRSYLGPLGWGVGIVVVIGMVIAVLLPSLCKPRESANRAKCSSNLHQIGLAILMYTQDNGGQYPPSLAVLPGQAQIGAEVFTCPTSSDERSLAADSAGVVADLTAAETHAAGHKPCLSYVYAGRGLTVATATEKRIVAYEPLENHDGGGTNVLFGDGHVEWIDSQPWPTMASAGGVRLAACRRRCDTGCGRGGDPSGRTPSSRRWSMCSAACDEVPPSRRDLPSANTRRC